MVNIYIEGQLIDQFNDENVEVVSQVVDISDVSKVMGDYSKTFTVPASKTNNRIFKHWYNASIDGGFDARTKVDGKIDIDGIPFKTGKFLLRNAKVDNGIITSYTINFFGNVSSLKDILGKDELTDLDLTDYDHDWTDDDVLDLLKVDDANPYPEVVYTLASKKRYYYDSSYGSFGDLTFNEAQLKQFNDRSMNIAYSGDNDYDDYDDVTTANFAYGVEWKDILPSLRVDTIIDAIEDKYDLTFSRDFFGTSEFNRLYMLLSSTEGGVTEGVEGRDINWFSTAENAGSDNTYVNPTTEQGTYVLSDGDELRMNLEVQCVTLNTTSNVNIKLNVNGEFVQSVSGITSTLDITGDIPFIGADWVYVNDTGVTRTLTCYYEATASSGSLTHKWNQQINSGISVQTLGQASFQGTASIKRNLPKLKLIDFLSGIFKAFKLVVVPQDDGSLYVNTLDSYYAQGEAYEISKYVDRSSLSIDRGELFSDIKMSFKESDTVLAKQFRDNNGKGYGDIEIKLTDDNGEPLDGETIDFELPFEQVVYERLPDVSTGDLTNIQAMHLCSGTVPHEPIKPEAILHYVAGKSNAGKPFLFKGQGSGTVTGDYNKVDQVTYTPSHHFSLINPFTALVFGEEFSTWDSAKINSTLYTNHYDNYVSSAFDIGRRTYNYTAKLPTILSANLKLNDVLIVDGIRLRLNKFSYNLLTGLTKMELVNKLDTSLNPFNGAPSKLYTDWTAQTYTFNLPNASDYTITEVNLGDGTGWTNVFTSFDDRFGESDHNRLNIVVSKRVTTGTHRRVKINLTKDGVTTTMIVLQDGREV